MLPYRTLSTFIHETRWKVAVERPVPCVVMCKLEDRHLCIRRSGNLISQVRYVLLLLIVLTGLS